MCAALMHEMFLV